MGSEMCIRDRVTIKANKIDIEPAINLLRDWHRNLPEEDSETKKEFSWLSKFELPDRHKSWPLLPQGTKTGGTAASTAAAGAKQSTDKKTSASAVAVAGVTVTSTAPNTSALFTWLKPMDNMFQGKTEEEKAEYYALRLKMLSGYVKQESQESHPGAPEPITYEDFIRRVSISPKKQEAMIKAARGIFGGVTSPAPPVPADASPSPAPSPSSAHKPAAKPATFSNARPRSRSSVTVSYTHLTLPTTPSV